MRKFLFWFGIAVAVFIIFIAGIYLVLSALLRDEPYIPRNSYLVCNIWGTLPEYTAIDALEEYLSGSVLDMAKLRKSLKMAEVDERINGVVMRIGLMQTGFAKIQELHQLISEFKKSGKKIIAHLDVATTRDYLLASACDSIFMQPGGAILLTGVAAEVTFYKGLLNKVGIEADFEHVGKYKSYPEPYTRQEMSETQREVINGILENRFSHILKTISANRNIPENKLEQMINNISGFTGDDALSSGLIDGLRYPDEYSTIFSQDDRKISEVSALNYAEIDPQDVGIETGPKLAVIYCAGTITGGEDGSDPIFGGTAGASRVIRNIESASRNKSIKAIILRIDSPGGSGIASEKIWNSVKNAAAEKPVIASISDLGASGGYYIAIGADTIIAQSTSLIGSIGVFIGKFSIESLYEKLGINVESIQRGKNARMFSLVKTFSASERKVVRKLIEDAYEDFITRVAESRGKTVEAIDEVAQGRVWSGEQGYELGLIDTLGGFQEAINIAKEQAQIDPDEDVQLVLYPKRRSIFGSFFRYLSVLQNLPYSYVEKFENHIRTFQLHYLMLMPYKINFN